MESILSYWEWEIQERGKKPDMCVHCHGIDLRMKMILLRESDVPSVVAGYYHPQCAEIAKDEYQKICVVCHKKYVLPRLDSSIEICPSCNKGEYKRINQTLRQELYAAYKYGKPATLTLKEWLQTLNHFNWTCVYCGQRRYTDIEHFIPVARGGGTTRDNCVPACRCCNVRKKGHNAFDIFPEVAPQIAEYLKSRA
jgi:5-methylcytosine-specific restriction endonuclease McrA